MTPPHRIADLHCHYPMHLLASRSKGARSARKDCTRRGWWWLDGVRASLFQVAARMMDFRGWRADWRVTFDRLEAAPAGLVLSVLYDPIQELFVVPRRQRPRKHAFEALLCQLDCVEAELARLDPHNISHVVARTGAQLEHALQNGSGMVFVHCVEGGFHLGPDPAMIVGQVQQLARRGVAYITLAHLFNRGVASNVCALPWLTDEQYDRYFHQRERGLTERGKAAVRTMYHEGILIDIAHMDAAALDATFSLVEQLDRESGRDPKAYPVIATHAGYRFDDQLYMLDERTIRRIKERDGVIGLILARHQLDSGLCAQGDTTPGFVALERHVRRIYDLTGSHAHTCLGSDLDGFIKPTVSAIETPAHFEVLEPWLRSRFPDGADAILFDNANRIVAAALQGR